MSGQKIIDGLKDAERHATMCGPEANPPPMKPMRCKTGIVDQWAGDCMACGAINGEVCRASPNSPTK